MFIIGKLHNGILITSNNPAMYTKRELAEKEAEKLASQHHVNAEFIVFKRVSVIRQVRTICPVETTRVDEL
jgi:hypothetical protein